MSLVSRKRDKKLGRIYLWGTKPVKIFEARKEFRIFR